MNNKEILHKISDTRKEIQKAWETYNELNQKMNELCDDLCKNIKLEDLRPMKKSDIVVGQRIFGKNNDKFYTLVIEEILGYEDLDFKSFTADGCRVGIFEHYVLKD